MKSIKDYYKGDTIMTRKEAANLIDYATAPETMAKIYNEANAVNGSRAAATELSRKLREAADIACEALREEYVPVFGITYDNHEIYYKKEKDVIL